MSWFKKSSVSECAGSILYDEKTFYNRFTQDLLNAEEEVIIESPYITTPRMRLLRPIFRKLVDKGIKVFVITRDPKEHEEFMEPQSEEEIQYLEAIGVQVLLCVGNHHRKLAILDRKILWEGSLNILSQTHSREIMRRIKSKKLAEEMCEFLKFDKFLY